MAGLRRDACDAIRREARKVGQGLGLGPCLIHLSAKQLSSHLPRPAVPAWSRAPPQNAAQMATRFCRFWVLQAHWQPRLKHTAARRAPPAGRGQKSESTDGWNPRDGVRVWMVAMAERQN